MTQVDSRITLALYAEPRMMAGRCKDGGRDGGKRAHAVVGGPGWQKALCGARPGDRTNGWGQWISPAVTCPRCLAKLEAPR
jgi:hypothetical protein